MEPAPEGPLVKPKRQMTEAQLDALKRGRAKLAEKRRQIKEDEESQAIKSVPEESTKDESNLYSLDESKSEKEETHDEEEEEHVYCSVM